MVSPVPNSPAPLRNPILHQCDPTLTKLVPASQLKQLRGAACLLCYDNMFTQPTMKTDDMRRMAYNLYHGNEEKMLYHRPIYWVMELVAMPICTILKLQLSHIAI